jgi:Methylamine utilisation protein MauE
MLDPVILMICIATLTIVTLASAWPKWREPERFRASVDAFALLPSVLVKPLSYLLPAVETAAAVGLLFASMRPFGAYALIALFVAFALALAINVVRGHTDIDCGCSGFIAAAEAASGAPKAIGWWHVGRAAFLALLAASVLLPSTGRVLVAFDYVSAGASTLFAVAAWFTLDVLLANLPKLNSLRNS